MVYYLCSCEDPQHHGYQCDYSSCDPGCYERGLERRTTPTSLARWRLGHIHDVRCHRIVNRLIKLVELINRKHREEREVSRLHRR